MRKLDYMSTDPATGPPLPPDMEYAWGCFPAMAACAIAVLAILLSVASFASLGDGPTASTYTALFGLTGVSWLLVVITIKRSAGLITGIFAGLVVLIPTLIVLGLLFHKF